VVRPAAEPQHRLDGRVGSIRGKSQNHEHTQVERSGHQCFLELARRLFGYQPELRRLHRQLCGDNFGQRIFGDDLRRLVRRAHQRSSAPQCPPGIEVATGNQEGQQSLRAVPQLLPFLGPPPAFGQSARRRVAIADLFAVAYRYLPISRMITMISRWLSVGRSRRKTSSGANAIQPNSGRLNLM
jgi:hypothetical protein